MTSSLFAVCRACVELSNDLSFIAMKRTKKKICFHCWIDTITSPCDSFQQRWCDWKKTIVCYAVLSFSTCISSKA